LFLSQVVGSTFVPIGTKIGIQTISPLFFVFGRFVIAVLCMLPLFVMNKHKQLSLREYRQAFLLAIFLFINATLFTIAIQYTTAVMSQILYTAAPIVVGLLGHYFFLNRLTKENIIGLCIALAGVLFLIMQSATKQEHMTFGTPFGNVLILIAMLSFSGYLLYSGVLAKTQVFTSVQLTSVTFVFVALILFVINVIGFLFFKDSIGVITTTGMSSMVLAIKAWQRRKRKARYDLTELENLRLLFLSVIEVIERAKTAAGRRRNPPSRRPSRSAPLERHNSSSSLIL